MDCALERERHLPPCRGWSEWHHVVIQQRIKGRYPRGAVYDAELASWRPLKRGEVTHPWVAHKTQDELLGDERNRIWLCVGHHELVTNHRVYPRTPAAALEFAQEFGFAADLEADEARRR